MRFQAEKVLRQARGAWLKGNLERARERFQMTLERTAASPEVVYPMARVVSEQGGKEEALELLERAAGDEHYGAVGTMYRAFILYDHGDLEAAENAIAKLKKSNVLATALAAFINFETGRTDGIAIHRGALWVGETAGRLLALLEGVLHKRGNAATDAFHQRIFTNPEATADEAGEKSANDESTNGVPAASLSDAFKSETEWWLHLERSFASGAHQAVVTLYERKDIPEKWRDVIAGIYASFSLMVTGKEKKAASQLEQIQKRYSSNAWAHFLGGVLETRLRDRRSAIYSFIRAQHLSDIEMNSIVEELMKTLDVEVEFLD